MKKRYERNRRSQKALMQEANQKLEKMLEEFQSE